jgi:hypothetical protein
VLSAAFSADSGRRRSSSFRAFLREINETVKAEFADELGALAGGGLPPNALIAHVLNRIGGTWEVWEDELTFPRLHALYFEWGDEPPVAIFAKAAQGLGLVDRVVGRTDARWLGLAIWRRPACPLKGSPDPNARRCAPVECAAGGLVSEHGATTYVLSRTGPSRSKAIPSNMPGRP